VAVAVAVIAVLVKTVDQAAVLVQMYLLHRAVLAQLGKVMLVEVKPL
jgi:hypothetical protein